MSFIEETKKELLLAYFQLAIVFVLDIIFIFFPLIAVENHIDTVLWIMIGIFGLGTLFSIIRVILLHLSIYYWKRGN